MFLVLQHGAINNIYSAVVLYSSKLLLSRSPAHYGPISFLLVQPVQHVFTIILFSLQYT